MPTIKVGGMRCQNCVNAVNKALNEFGGLSEIKVNLEAGEASWKDQNPASPADPDKVKEAINKIGFEAK
ncbi:heavy-metal-associated domain-containing protein [Desulfovibrio sp. OttesenSCG-928-C14]|nr:heavy-metal-associated domain-containing protein [Desulfovibrio sp. OttesenSCG-928-C14]